MVNIASTNIPNIENAVAYLNEKLNPQKDDLILYFASSSYDPNDLAKEMDKAFIASSVGCTTSGELVSGKMLDNSIVAMCLNNEVIEDFCIEVIENLSVGLGSKIDNVFKSFENHYNCSIAELDYKDYVGIVLIDGVSNKEEAVNDLVGNKSNIIFVGGSAGDNMKFEKTHVFKNGKAYPHSSLLILLKPKKGYDILKTQSCIVSKKSLIATKVIEAERRVIEFDNKPAAIAYSNALQCKKDELSIKFSTNPLGIVMSSNDPFIRSPKAVEGDDVLFYCSIKEGQELNLLESTDIIVETKVMLQEKVNEFGTPSCILNFNCLLRKLELIDKKQDEKYGEIFDDIPTIGFHTYGESYIGHINQTATMLLFK